jgi:hypothetical protein
LHRPTKVFIRAGEVDYMAACPRCRSVNVHEAKRDFKRLECSELRVLLDTFGLLAGGCSGE